MVKTIKLFKEFLQYRKDVKLSQMIDIELNDITKVKISAFDKDIILLIYYKFLQRLSSELITGDVSPEFVRGAKFASKYIRELFKDYKIK